MIYNKIKWIYLNILQVILLTSIFEHAKTDAIFTMVTVGKYIQGTVSKAGYGKKMWRNCNFFLFTTNQFA